MTLPKRQSFLAKHRNKIVGSSITAMATMLFLAFKFGNNRATDKELGLEPGKIASFPTRLSLWDQTLVPKNPESDVCFASSIGGGMATYNTSCVSDFTSPKSIQQVMERRFAHLQQARYRLKITLKRLGFLKSSEPVITTEMLLNESRRRKQSKIDGIPSLITEKYITNDQGKNELLLIEENYAKEEEAINIGPTQDGKEVLMEIYDFMNKLIKILEVYPEKLPDLALSDKVITMFDNFKKTNYVICERDFNWALNRDDKNIHFRPWMLVSHESTDKILAAFGNAAQDGPGSKSDDEPVNRDFKRFGESISKHCFEICFTEQMRDYYNDYLTDKQFRDAASRNFSNPYRDFMRKHGLA